MNQMNVRDGSMMMKSNNRIRKVFVALFISLLAVSVAVASSPLTQPKADGLIGEQANGYLGLVTQSAPSNIKKLVKDTNAKRKAGYQRIAAKQGTIEGHAIHWCYIVLSLRALTAHFFISYRMI